MEFVFDKFIYDNKKKALGLFYNYGEHKFIHIIEFPKAKNINELGGNEKIALNRAFFYLMMAEGINYYKVFLADKVKYPDLTKDEANFFNIYYNKELGEVSCTNNKKIPARLFQYKIKEHRPLIPYQHKEGAVILVDGGNKSIASMEMLRKVDSKLLSIITGTDHSVPVSIQDTLNSNDKDSIVIHRHISPNLFDLPGVYNGKIPGIGNIAFINMVASILYGFNNIIISQDQYDNEDSVDWRGREIHHKWSKSLEFERMFDKFMKEELHPHLNYFSFLRPLSEFHIAKLFSNFPQHHKRFINCKRALTFNDIDRRWCQECDKCRFMFIMLAPFVENVVDMFGKNLLEDAHNIESYKGLIGLGKHEPFDCVGEFEEAILSFKSLQNSKFENTIVVKEMNKLIDENYPDLDLDKLTKKYFNPCNEHNIPEIFFKEFIKWM